MPPSVLAIGHSNHPFDRLLVLLKHEVEVLVDIGGFPGSKKHPHFSRDSLVAARLHGGIPRAVAWLQ